MAKPEDGQKPGNQPASRGPDRDAEGRPIQGTGQPERGEDGRPVQPRDKPRDVDEGTEGGDQTASDQPQDPTGNA